MCDHNAGAVSFRRSHSGTAVVLLATNPCVTRCNCVDDSWHMHMSLQHLGARRFRMAQGPATSCRGFARHPLQASASLRRGRQARSAATLLVCPVACKGCGGGIPGGRWSMLEPGPYGNSGRGRDEGSGRREAAGGIYGGRANDREFGQECDGCACGEYFRWTNWNHASCRSCYCVLTRQLARRFLELFGSWSDIHDRIFIFLIETQFIGEDPSTDALYRADGLAEARRCGLPKGNGGLPLPAVLRRRRVVGIEGQRCFAARYRIGDVDWIPPSEAVSPDARHEHVLVWHPPMLRPPLKAVARVADELARSANHPLAHAISRRCARAAWVVEQQVEASRQGRLQVYPAPCTWCGHFTPSSCDGVPACSTSRGWRCEFRVCRLCESLYERCRSCCRWTGLPARASAEARVRCQGSAVVLGPIAQKSWSSRRFPYRWLPHFDGDLGQLPEAYGPAARRRCVERATVRRVLCEIA